jgi:hypothetical protein
MNNPEPYRSPLSYHTPTVLHENINPVVQVSIPNEEPDTEDDLTINVAFTHEGITVDLYVSDGEPVATFGQTYEEFVGTIHDLDPANHRPVDAPIQRVAALSADLRLVMDDNDADEFGDSEAEAAVARELLDAIDALLGR